MNPADIADQEAASFHDQDAVRAIQSQHHHQHQQHLQSDQRVCAAPKDAHQDEVKHVDLFGVRIVALTINAKERLCLAQISNTLLKEFSYNEIHNRRVALGITCVQCTPVQLEMLRRAGAMPSSSRRCGMITMREAERLCRSFLVEEQPPELPENFYFTVAHRVNYGCKGRFVPARYISSRAKCIECFYCGEFYSPNKFIFHSHKQPNVTDCNPPDSPNINSWRKHIDLDWTQDHSQEIKYAWEDVKSLFNGGTRRRAPTNAPINGHDERPSPTGSTSVTLRQKTSTKFSPSDDHDEEEEIDVESHDGTTINNACNKNKISENLQNPDDRPSAEQFKHQNSTHKTSSNKNTSDGRFSNNELSSNPKLEHYLASVKRSLQTNESGKRFASSHRAPLDGTISASHNQEESPPAAICYYQSSSHVGSTCPTSSRQRNFLPQSLDPKLAVSGQSLLMGEHLASGPVNHSNHIQSNIDNSIADGHKISSLNGIDYLSNTAPVTSTNFIYNQLYSQLIQPQQRHQEPLSKLQQSRFSDIDAAQLALRQHLWTSLLANIQRNAAAATVMDLNKDNSNSK